MLSALGQRFVDGLKSLKEKVLSLPALLRNINGKRREFQELLDKANSFTSLLSVSSTSIYEHKISGVDTDTLTGNRVAPGAVRSSKTDSATTVIENFTAPDKKEVYDNSKLADDLEAAIEYINATIAQLKLFPKDKLAVAEIKSLTSLKAQFHEKLNDIVTLIGEFYDRHVPALYEEVLDHCLTQLNSMIPHDSYDEMELTDQTITSHDTFAGKKDAAIEFTTFVAIDGLNQEEFKTSSLFVAITGVVYESKTAAISSAVSRNAEQFARRQAGKQLPETLIELVKTRNNALRKKHNRVVETTVGKIKQAMSARDPAFAKLIARYEAAEEAGRDSGAIRNKIDGILRDLYQQVALLDSEESGTTRSSTDDVYKKLVAKREAAILKKAKEEVIHALDKQIEEHLESLIAARNVKRERSVKSPRNTKTTYHMAFFLTTLTRVRGPGMFDPGVEISGTNVSAIKRALTKELRLLLSMHTVAPIIGKLPIGRTTQEMRHSPLGNVAGIVDIKVVDDIIEIQTATKQEAVVDKTIIPDVLLALNAMFRTNRQTRFYISKEMRGSSSGIMLKATYVKS